MSSLAIFNVAESSSHSRPLPKDLGLLFGVAFGAIGLVVILVASVFIWRKRQLKQRSTQKTAWQSTIGLPPYTPYVAEDGMLRKVPTAHVRVSTTI